MSYYMGDYYAGDYYRGDPGIFGFVRKVAGAAAGFIPGVGGIAQKLLASKAGAGMASAATSLARRGVGAALAHPVLSAAGAAGLAGGAGMLMGRSTGRGPGGAGAPMVDRRGRVRGMITPGGPMLFRRRRRMRVTNPKALRRSLRRVMGFAKVAKKVLTITHPPRGARMRFKFPKRRSTRKLRA